MHVLKNDRLEIKIAKKGAEMKSVIGVADGHQYLWVGDPAYWNSSAPWCFPVCGRSWEGEYTYRGQRYPMRCHGFALLEDFVLVSGDDTTAVFELADNEKTRKSYPFAFLLRITYTLEGDRLSVNLSVKNTGNVMLPATFGAHPGFATPPVGEVAFAGYSIDWGKESELFEVIMEDGKYDTGVHVPFATEGGVLPLCHDLFPGGGHFLGGVKGDVTLHTPGGHTVTVTAPDARFWGLWSIENRPAPYVCIEPWLGLPAPVGAVEDIEKKDYLFHVEPGEKASYDVSYKFN